MPNALAWIALCGWPVVAFLVYASRQQQPVARTTAWMLVIPLMFLPSNLWWHLPGVLHLDKYRAALLSIFVCLELFHRRPLSETLRAHLFARLVLAVMIWGVFQTSATNTDALRFGPLVRLPGLTTYDAISTSLGLFQDFYLPFAIGQRVFRTERDLRDLLEVLARAGFLYLPLCAIELRLSPQLHNWVYGYHPSDFLQSLRGGSFRPMVFMNHGLTLAMFLFAAFAASLELRRHRVTLRPSPSARAVIIGVFLALSRSLGATLFAAAVTAAHFLLSPRTMARIAAVIAVVVVAYPTLRASGVVPTRDILQAVSAQAPERAASLGFRFMQEEQLLDRARERPIYGWGGYGRSQIWKPWGQVSIPDGFWIIILGASGYVGFACAFALLVVPLLRYALAQRRLPEQAQRITASLALLSALFTLDLLPNSQLGYVQSVLAGALFGLAASLRVRAQAPRAPAAAPAVTPAMAPGGHA